METSWEAEEIERWVMNDEPLYREAQVIFRRHDRSAKADFCGMVADTCGIKATTSQISEAVDLLDESI